MRVIHTTAFTVAMLWMGATAAHSAADNVILGIDTEHGPGKQGSSMRVVRIHATTTPMYTVFRLNDPMRVVIDISGAAISHLKTPMVLEDGVLGQISTRQFTNAGLSVGRIMVSFEQDVTYDVVTQGQSIVLKARYGAGTLAKKEPATTKPSIRIAASTEAPPVPVAASSELSGVAVISDSTDTRTDSATTEKLLLTLSPVPSYEVKQLHNPERLVIDLKSTHKTMTQRQLELPTALVQRVRFGAQPDGLRVVLDLQGDDITHEVIRARQGLIVTVHTQEQNDTPTETLRIHGDRAAPTAHHAPHTVSMVQHTQVAGFATQATALSRSTPAQISATKKRINIDLKDADIVNVIRFLSDVSGENIITGDDVTGKISLRLRNVPWDKALDTILNAKGYDKVRQNNILRIAPADVLQREREATIAKRLAETQVEETKVKIITVNYANAADIVTQIKPLLTTRGSVQTDTRTNTIVVEDIRSNIGRLVELTRRLDTQTPQVLIEARIVEASSSFLQEVGIQWGGTGQATSKAGNPTGLNFPGDVIVSGAADAIKGNVTQGTGTPGRYAVNLPAAIGAGSGGGLGFQFGSLGGSQILNLRLSAMEENGTGRIISSPRVTTLDNKTAKIAQGIDIPITVVSAAGANTRYIPANLELEVTPHVTNDGVVSMRIRTQKAEPNFTRTGAAGDPSIERKFAETEVQVQDGETTVIGGIYTRVTSEKTVGVPVLSRIPILGWLFRNHREEDRRAELLVFITPRIVNKDAALIASDAEPLSGTPGGPTFQVPAALAAPTEDVPSMLVPQVPAGPAPSTHHVPTYQAPAQPSADQQPAAPATPDAQQTADAQKVAHDVATQEEATRKAIEAIEADSANHEGQTAPMVIP